MIGEEVLKEHKLEDTKLVVRNSTAQVISMIGVLEHLQDPRGVLKEIIDNKNKKMYFTKFKISYKELSKTSETFPKFFNIILVTIKKF